MTTEADNWLKAIDRDDTQAFQALYQSYHLKLYRFLLALLEQPAPANDLLHRVMLDLWRQPKQLLGKPDLQLSLLQLGWLAASQQPSGQSLPTSAKITRLELPGFANQHLQPESIASCWHQLNLSQRALIYLAMTEGLACRDISIILQLSETQVSEGLHQALERLRNSLVVPNSD